MWLTNLGSTSLNSSSVKSSALNTSTLKSSSRTGHTPAGTTIVADELTRVAAIVNPIGDLEQMLAYLQAHNLRLRYIFATSNDAVLESLTYGEEACRNPVLCQTELAYRTGAKGYVFQAADPAESTFTLLKSGDVIEFGLVRLKVIQSGSNRLSLLVYDLAVSDRVPEAEWGPDALAFIETLPLGDSRSFPEGQSEVEVPSVAGTSGSVAQQPLTTNHDLQTKPV
jgi:hypothetical protein